MVSDQVSGMIGSAVKRKEDPRLITGQGGYTADVRLEGMTYMAVARSPYAHARIRRIDPAGALRRPEVPAVLAGGDVIQRCKTPLRLYGVDEQMKIKAAGSQGNRRVPDHRRYSRDCRRRGGRAGAPGCGSHGHACHA